MTDDYLSAQDVRMEAYIARKALDKAKGVFLRWKEVEDQIGQGCRHCAHFNHQGTCVLANGIAPPPEIVATGCDSWATDGIPF
jgi:hypothetical protein